MSRSGATDTEAQFEDESADGEFVRQESAFRNRVTPESSGRFPAAAGRYHLYVSYACPWAHRTILFRRLKKLEDVISMTVVDPIRDERGWAFTFEPDPIRGFAFLAEAYRATDPQFDGRVTVPTLWDKEEGVVVNNESAEILRMFNAAFDGIDGVAAEVDFYPAELREEIDAINERVYENVNNGVYRCGFATSQAAYEKAFGRLFETLDWMDRRLGECRYLVGDKLTEADWRAFTTLIRFDPVYVGHFKCNQRRIADYQNLAGYLRELYQMPGVAETVQMDHIKRHYYVTHDKINPMGIVPVGPELDLERPHGRG